MNTSRFFMILLAWSAILAIGWAMVRVLGGKETRLSVWETLGWSWLIGAPLTALLLGVVGALVPLVPAAFAIAGIGLVFALVVAIRVKREHIQWRLWPCQASIWEKILTSIPAGLLVFGAMCTADSRFLWDGLVIWDFKARAIFLSGTSIPSAFLSEPHMVFSHPSYPMGLPLLYAFVYSLSGAPDPEVAKFFSYAFFGLGSLAFWGLIARMTGRLFLAHAAIVCVACFPPVFGERQISVGIADVPLAMLNAVAIGGLILWRLRGMNLAGDATPKNSAESGRGFVYLTIAVASLMPWLKTDGIVLWATFMIVMALILFREWGVRRLALAALPGLSIVVAWRCVCVAVGVPKEGVFAPLELDRILQGIDDLPNILPLLTWFLVSMKYWGIFWWIAVVALVMLYRSTREIRQCAILLSLAVGLPLAVATGAYMMTTLGYVWHISTSFWRIAFQVAYPAIIVVLLAVRVSCWPTDRGMTCADSGEGAQGKGESGT